MPNKFVDHVCFFSLPRRRSPVARLSLGACRLSRGDQHPFRALTIEWPGPCLGFRLPLSVSANPIAEPVNGCQVDPLSTTQHQTCSRRDSQDLAMYISRTLQIGCNVKGLGSPTRSRYLFLQAFPSGSRLPQLSPRPGTDLASVPLPTCHLLGVPLEGQEKKQSPAGTNRPCLVLPVPCPPARHPSSPTPRATASRVHHHRGSIEISPYTSTPQTRPSTTTRRPSGTTTMPSGRGGTPYLCSNFLGRFAPIRIKSLCCPCPT
jgi:hypothetical protein